MMTSLFLQFFFISRRVVHIFLRGPSRNWGYRIFFFIPYYFKNNFNFSNIIIAHPKSKYFPTSSFPKHALYFDHNYIILNYSSEFILSVHPWWRQIKTTRDIVQDRDVRELWYWYKCYSVKYPFIQMIKMLWHYIPYVVSHRRDNWFFFTSTAIR